MKTFFRRYLLPLFVSAVVVGTPRGGLCQSESYESVRILPNEPMTAEEALLIERFHRMTITGFSLALPLGLSDSAERFCTKDADDNFSETLEKCRDNYLSELPEDKPQVDSAVPPQSVLIDVARSGPAKIGKLLADVASEDLPKLRQHPKISTVEAVK